MACADKAKATQIFWCLFTWAVEEDIKSMATKMLCAAASRWEMRGGCHSRLVFKGVWISGGYCHVSGKGHNKLSRANVLLVAWEASCVVWGTRRTATYLQGVNCQSKKSKYHFLEFCQAGCPHLLKPAAFLSGLISPLALLPAGFCFLSLMGSFCEATCGSAQLGDQPSPRQPSV